MNHRLYKFSILGALVLLALLLGACIQEEPTPETPAEALAPLALAGTAWQYEYLGEKSDDIPVIEGTRPTLAIFATRYAGNGGCNFYLGAYEADGTRVTFWPPAQTGAICGEPEGIMEQEATFISGLTNTIEYGVDDGNLVLYSTDRQRLLTLSPMEPVPFRGTTWSLRFLWDDEQWLPIIPGSAITIQFEDENFSGSAGCNSYNGVYEEKDGKLVMPDVVALTTKECADPEGVMAQEQNYVTLLTSAVAYEKAGGMLLLLNEEDEPILIFSAE